MKTRSSTKIVIGFALVLAVGYGGYRAYTDWRVSNLKFDEIKPGQVNIVGVNLGAGFRIIVANQIAQLVEVSPEEQSNPDWTSEDYQGSDRKRVPIREMLQTLQGNEEALSKFVSILGGLKEEDLPADRVFWSADDIQKAMAGDKELEKKLSRDLNMNLDGTPLDEIRFAAIANGIVIQAPVAVNVNVGGQNRLMTATVSIPFKPRLITRVEAQYQNKFVDNNAIKGYYIEESRIELQKPANERENIRAKLGAIISPAELSKLATHPERVLASAKVVVNEDQIERAELETYDTNHGKMSNLRVHLTSEGADRLWSYSKKRVGTQLLLITNGIAIAAPRIQHELSQRDLTITQMPDLVLAREAKELIDNIKKGAEKA